MGYLSYSLKLFRNVTGSLNWFLGENVLVAVLNTAVKLYDII